MKCRAVVTLTVLAIIGLVPSARAASHQKFYGKLNDHLTLGEEFMPLFWAPANAAQRAELGSRVTTDDKVWAGSLDFGYKPAITFKAALVKTDTGSYTFYVDRRQTGTLTQSDAYPLTRKKPGSMLEAHFMLPLSHGPIHSFPAAVMVPDPNAKFPWKKPVTLMVSGADILQGTVQLPKRKLLVGYEYDLSHGRVDLSSSVEEMDTNGDGKFNYFSERDIPKKGKLPVFNVGDRYLQTKSLDLATDKVTLVALPASAWGNRIRWQTGDVLPDFPLEPLRGSRTSFNQVRGKYTLIDFWASWCEPCMSQFPALKTAYAKYHVDGLQILGIDGDAKVKAGLAALAKEQAPWPEATAKALAGRFDIHSWPTEILVDAHGKVLTSSSDGPMEDKSLQKTLAKYISAK